MSISQDTPSAFTVRGWTTEDVVLALQQNGLENAVPSFRKRGIDGNAFLKLTESQLKTSWNHELSFTSVWKIVKLIYDIKAQPEKPSVPFGRLTKTFQLHIPAKTDDKPKLKAKPLPPPGGFWKNQGKPSDVGTLGKLPLSLPGGPTRWRDPVPTPLTLGNRLPPALPVSSNNRRDHSPARVPTSASSSGNSRDQITAPPGPTIPSGNRRDGGVAGSSTSAPCLPPYAVQRKNWKPKLPGQMNKPNLFGIQSLKNSNDPPNPTVESNPPFESMSTLAQQLSDAMRARTQTNPQNGWSPPKPPVESRRPVPKIVPAVPFTPPAVKSTTYLPMPPPMPTGQEDEHIMEIVSSIQIPSVTSEVKEIVCHNDEMYENSAVEPVHQEIYEEPDMSAWETAKEALASEETIPEESSDIYEYIGEERLAGEYYVQPTGAVQPSSAHADFESTQDQVEDLPVAPSVPIKSHVAGFMSNLKASLFRSSESKSLDVQSRDKVGAFKGTSVSPCKEKLNVSSELRKSPSSSTTSLITPNKGNAGQTPDQRLPPNLRPLPPTPGIGPFRPGPPNTSSTMSRKISTPKTALGQQPWYHNVDRRRGEELVCNREDGTFLIRPSTQNQNPYTLTIWFGNRVYNIAVRYRSDQKYALGSEKQNEQSFWSLEEMVAFYQTEQLVLFSGGERSGLTSLKSSP